MYRKYTGREWVDMLNSVVNRIMMSHGLACDPRNTSFDRIGGKLGVESREDYMNSKYSAYIKKCLDLLAYKTHRIYINDTSDYSDWYYNEGLAASADNWCINRILKLRATKKER